MATTYVRASTTVTDEVAVTSESLGPGRFTGKLERPRLPPMSKDVQFLSIDRILDGTLYCINVPFSLAPAAAPAVYVASLQVLLRGHGLGSMIWWRWRAAQAGVGYWFTDHQPHEVLVAAGGVRYRFRVTGVGTVGYDDIKVDLDRV